MRKLLYIALFALLIVACQSNKQGQLGNDTGDSLKNVSAGLSKSGAVIKFDTIYFDLGSLPIDGPNQTCDFLFANNGNKPLVIEKVESSCPCLDIEYPKEAVAPGKRSKITLTLKMNEISSGQFYRSAFVYSNGSEEPTEIILQGIKCYE